MPRPVGWVPYKPPSIPLSGTAGSSTDRLDPQPNSLTDHPEIQARHLLSIAQNYSPEEYSQYLSTFNNPKHEWPNFVASCILPKDNDLLERTLGKLRSLPCPSELTEMLPEPARGMAFKPAPAGYSTKVKEPEPSRNRSPTVVRPGNVSARPAVGEVFRLGVAMQPMLSRRRSVTMAKKNGRPAKSMFLSGRKSEKARAAEEREREAREKAEQEAKDKEQEAKDKEQEAKDKEQEQERERVQAENTNGDTGNADESENGRRTELLDLDLVDSDLDVTVRDAAEIERIEGMDEDMVRTQRDKEARPRHVGDIVKKMHSTAAGARNVVVADSAPAPIEDTGYARVLRMEEQARKRQEQAEAARRKEKVLAEQRKQKFNRRRKRKLRKAGKLVQYESDEAETSPVPESPEPPEEASHSTQTHIVDATQHGDYRVQEPQRPRLVAPPGEDHYGGRYNPPPEDRYRRHSYDGPQSGPPPPPHDPRRYDTRPPWSSPQHPYHPSPAHYGSAAPPYYAPPSAYYYPGPHYYPSPHPPPPTHGYFPQPRAPPRLSRQEFEKRKRELYENIGDICNQLHAEDARVIDDFLDNQDYMFRENEKTKYIVVKQENQEEVLLRIDRETRTWEVVRKTMS